MQGLTVRFVGPIRRPGPEREIVVQNPDLVTVADLLHHLGYDGQEQSRLHVLQGGRRLVLDAPLQGVEAVEILVAVGGG
jgi:hypothetical protein